MTLSLSDSEGCVLCLHTQSFTSRRRRSFSTGGHKSQGLPLRLLAAGWNPRPGPGEGKIRESKYSATRAPRCRAYKRWWTPSRPPPGPERSFLSLADCHGGTSWSGHHAGKCGRKEKGRKIEGWERRGGAHRAGNAGPNLAVSYFRTAPWGPRTRDTGGGQSGCVNALCPSSRSRQPLLGCLGREEGGNAACQHCAG